MSKLASCVGIGVLLLSMTGAGARAQQRQDVEPACVGVSCSDVGTCMTERGRPFCLCDDGYAASALSCVPVEGPADLALRARRSPGVADRVLDVAMTQIGRRSRGIGAERETYPFAMRRYVPPAEWWCSEFVAWVYAAAGVPFTGGAEGGWLIGENHALRTWFQRHELWVGRDDPEWETFEPRPGDFFRLHTERGGHSAIVRRVEGSTLYTIEGNVNGHVRLGRFLDWRSERRIDGFGMLALPNEAPELHARLEPLVVLPDAVHLVALADDDGLRDRLVFQWSVLAGPGPVQIRDAGSPSTSAELTDPGRYVFALGVHDGEREARVRLEVEALENQPPVVRATAPSRVVIGEEALLSATIDDDGLRGDVLEASWEVIEGPGAVSFTDPASASTACTFAVPGLYVLRLEAYDGELHSSVEVEVSVGEPTWGGCSGAGRPGRPSGHPAWSAGLVLVLLLRQRRSRRP